MKRTFAGAVALCAALLSGCSESVEPNLGIDRPFTIWGLFNPRADTQAARLFTIESDIQLITSAPIDATITSTDLATGEVRVWQDSVVQLADGTYRHVYWSAFRAEHGHTYRLEARRSDGAASSATVTVPMPAALRILPPSVDDVRQAVQSVLVEGTPPSLPRIDVAYEIFGLDPLLENGVVITIPYANREVIRSEGRRLDIDVGEDFRTITLVLEERGVRPQPLGLRDMTIRVHVGDAGWVSPSGSFDPDVLVEPGVLTNVENGFGFVGAGYVLVETWRPPEDLLQRAGFTGL